ncbi:MAG: EAL domain-containing protein [Vogesella sp.]|uniref:EAL domain-containing protein n=1 Tax=Vogesella sp. TaxID=1904252 RepID=UPI00391AF02A
MNHQAHPISTHTLLDILEQQRIGAEYQPIKHVHTLQTVGHEALARFYDDKQQAVAPQDVFAALHASPITLVQAEQLSKRWQIANAPADGLLFLNLDPDVIDNEASPEQHPVLRLLDQPNRMVVEIIENASIQEARRSLWLASCLAGMGIKTALDDIGGNGTMLSLPILCSVDIFKFDRAWLRAMHQPAQKRMLCMLLDYARQEKRTTILEGIETAADLALARELGVDWVQGYYFKSEFIHTRA